MAWPAGLCGWSHWLTSHFPVRPHLPHIQAPSCNSSSWPLFRNGWKVGSGGHTGAHWCFLVRKSLEAWALRPQLVQASYFPKLRTVWKSTRLIFLVLFP